MKDLNKKVKYYIGDLTKTEKDELFKWLEVNCSHWLRGQLDIYSFILYNGHEWLISFEGVIGDYVNAKELFNKKNQID